MQSMLHPSRRELVRVLLLAGGFAPAMLALVREAGANAQVPIIPGVQEFTGDFRVNGQLATVGLPVKPGDVVTTGANGSGIVIIGQHAYMIREMSEIEFYDEDFLQDAEGSVKGVIRIVSGAMLSVFGKTDTTIKTPLANIGIRGTACYIDARDSKRTYACVCYGRGELAAASDGRHLETVVTTHHDSPRYIYAPGAGPRIEKAEVIDHKDAELRLLEKLVNRKPPFDKLKKQKDRY